MIEIPKLSDEIRASLASEAQLYIAALEKTNAELHARIVVLEAAVAELQAHSRQTSRNSSRPPSSDPPSAPPRPARTATGRKQGAQAGHPRHERQLLAVDEVDAVVEHYPDVCPHCQTPLPAALPDLAEPERQQVWEIPPVKPQVTEHHYHKVACPACHHPVVAPRPADVPTGRFGPRVIALVGLLHARYRLSVREIVALVQDIFQLPLSTGGVIGLCQVLSVALRQPDEHSRQVVQAAGQANVDETGWKQQGKRCWLWVAVSVGAVVFMIADRSSRALKALVGEQFGGIITSDRFKSYLALPPDRRQVCWAHLKRNWQAFSERDGPMGAWGTRVLVQIEQLFTLWHHFRAGQCTRAVLQSNMVAVQGEIRQLLTEGQALPLPRARTFCQDVLALWPALWTFLTVEGVEPTNNAAERALRPAVLWRKGCFGTQSATGNVFVTRLLTVIMTCRQHNRPVWTFLTEAVQAYIAGQPAPDLFSPTP